METVHAKEESKRLRTQLTELRDKFNDLEARVGFTTPGKSREVQMEQLNRR